MTTKSSNKWILARIILPATLFAGALVGCGNANHTAASEQGNDSDRVAFVVDSLLRENRKLTDSLSVVNERLDSCENAHSKRCPQDKKKPAQQKPTPKKPVQKAPVQKKPVQATPTQTPAATTPANEIKIGTNNSGNNTVVIGNENEINNIVINGCTSVVLDTLAQVKTTRRIMSGHAKVEYTYTK